MSEHQGFFQDHYNITARAVEKVLSAALKRGGDFADLYFEYAVQEAINLEESLVKGTSKNIAQGVGVRVVSGDKTGYAYTEELTPDKMLQAARTASLIAQERSGTGPVSVDGPRGPEQQLYASSRPLVEFDAATKLDLMNRADRAARGYDPRIKEVQVSLSSEIRIVSIANSQGFWITDYRPLCRMMVVCIAQDGASRQVGNQGGGGRSGLEFFDSKPPEYFAHQAARQALIQLDAREAPAGSLEVILGTGWPGILLHEAVGHGLEADFNRKKISAFSGLIGQRVASELCTVVDDGTLPLRRGSLNVDDEGTPTHSTVLIENGILRGYMQDRLSARLMKAELTGNGRRQSYAHIPMPRMTNTFMPPGPHSKDEIISSVRFGLYAVSFGGGQVDITNGKFVFSASEAYLIEDGKITAPVRGATLIGNGPDVLTKVTMVGNDLQLDEGVGFCGKHGQLIPVGVGLPTVKVRSLTVGGTSV
ncbi:MAG: metalloprotease TldD [Acidobacteria bacterium]|nr:metalloprotease TldD [Acidobacteriota bacterium]